MICEWFALCDRPATHLGHHPTLQLVPVCDEHMDWPSAVVPIENALAMGWAQ